MSDSITYWFTSAGRFPLLSESETIRIARKIQSAEYGSPEYIKNVNKLSVHNLRLVTKFVHSYIRGHSSTNWGDAITADLLQQGYFGLRRAAEKFDPERGYTFSTYAKAWISQAVGKWHVSNMSLIRVPESTARAIHYYEKHGTIRDGRSEKNILELAEFAKKAYSLVYYDCNLKEGSNETQLETLSDDNRINYQHSDYEYSPGLNAVGLMTDLDIPENIQKLILSYIKRGNLETTCMKEKVNYKRFRPLVREAIKKIQEHTGATSYA